MLGWFSFDKLVVSKLMADECRPPYCCVDRSTVRVLMYVDIVHLPLHVLDEAVHTWFGKQSLTMFYQTTIHT